MPTQATYKHSEQELYLEHLIDDDIGRWRYLDYDNVVVFTKNDKKQFFRIYNVIKSINKVSCYCKPLFFTDCINNVILNQGAQTLTGQEALALALRGTNFVPHSNIPTLNIVDWYTMNTVEALLSDDERSFINRWGGEFLIDGWDVYINSRVGSETGVEINFGYNLSEIEYSIDTSEVVTRIIPISKDNIMLNNANAPWVNSANLGKYPTVKARVIEFDDIFLKQNPDDAEGYNSEDEVRQALIQRCEHLFNEGIDQPKSNFKVDMVNLSNVTAYKEFVDLVTVNYGDTLAVNVPHLSLSNLKVRVIDYEWDVLNDDYLTIELGSETSNFILDQVDIQHKINNITNSDGTVKADRLNGVINGLQTQFKTTLDVAQKQDVFAFLFECVDESDPNFGALAIGTQGFQIANGYIPGTKNWNWRTAGNGKGLVADEITTGILNADLLRTGNIRSVDGKVEINLENGAFALKNDNGEVIIDGSSKIFKIKHTFERQYTAPQSAPEFQSEFVHNLGYVPAYMAYQVDTVSTIGDRTNTLLPALTIRRNTANNTLENSAIIRCNADENNIIVQYYRADLTLPNTFKVKFFILEERLL